MKGMFGVYVPSELCLGSKLDVAGTTCEVLFLNTSWVAVKGVPMEEGWWGHWCREGGTKCVGQSF